MKNLDAKKLLEKYHSGTLSGEEKAILEAWYNTHITDQSAVKLTEAEINQDILKISEKVLLITPKVRKLSNTKLIIRTLSAAAMLVLIFAVTLRYLNPPVKTNNAIIKAVEKITPAQNKAILTLAGNKKILLDDASIGELAKQTGISITKTIDGKLKYKIIENDGLRNAQLQFNTISTPRGAQYQVELADGSLIWLNSSSSITFPTRFEGNKREVSITGEVYFEVAKNKEKPFFVKSIDQTIQVLGTHFNVDGHEKSLVKTTLLEGAVKLSFAKIQNSTNLLPGQKSIYNTSTLKLQVTKVDTEKAVDWKNGYFLFYDDNLITIMDKVSRWYDVDVVYTSTQPTDEKFSGTISRSKSLADVLKVLEVSGQVNFKIEGRRITVMN